MCWSSQNGFDQRLRYSTEQLFPMENDHMHEYLMIQKVIRVDNVSRLKKQNEHEMSKTDQGTKQNNDKSTADHQRSLI